MGRDSGGGAGWCCVGGGRSDVGLGVVGWPDGACQDCKRRVRNLLLPTAAAFQ